MIIIKSGTTQKETSVATSIRNEEGKNNYQIHVDNTSVSISISTDGTASGGWNGTYYVTRHGSASIPLEVIIEMAAEGLLKSEYELSNTDFRKLLLAVSSALPQ